MTTALPKRPTRFVFGRFWLLLLVLAATTQPCLWLGSLAARPLPQDPAACCGQCQVPDAPARHAPITPSREQPAFCCQILQAVEPFGPEHRFDLALHPLPPPPAAEWPGAWFASVSADADHAPVNREAGPPDGSASTLVRTVLRRCVPSHAPPFLA